MLEMRNIKVWFKNLGIDITSLCFLPLLGGVCILLWALSFGYWKSALSWGEVYLNAAILYAIALEAKEKATWFIK